MREFDPARELDTFWPDWTVRLRPLATGRGEVFTLRPKLIHVDPCQAGERWAFAHVLAHLRMGHQFTAPGTFSEEQCAKADRDAEKRIVTALAPSGQQPVFRL